MGSLAVTDIFDHSSQIVKSYTKNIIKGISDPSERAVTLYYSIRDGLQYYPYEIHLFESSVKGSIIASVGQSSIQRVHVPQRSSINGVSYDNS